MQKFDLNSFTKGWFIGDFSPTISNTDKFEASIKRYNKGDYEESHVHKIADEITVIISGKVSMNGVTYKKNDVLLIEKGESTDFKVLSREATTCVIKFPSVKGDKYKV